MIRRRLKKPSASRRAKLARSHGDAAAQNLIRQSLGRKRIDANYPAGFDRSHEQESIPFGEFHFFVFVPACLCGFGSGH